MACSAGTEFAGHLEQRGEASPGRRSGSFSIIRKEGGGCIGERGAIMRRPQTVRALEELGRVRLSPNFFMREFLFSEISVMSGIPNLPDDPDLAIAAGSRLCETLLEPLRDPHARKETCQADLQELRRTVEHHVAEEERDLMPRAAKLGAAGLRDVGHEMEVRIHAGETSERKVAGGRVAGGRDLLSPPA
jgi:hypothetical protein